MKYSNNKQRVNFKSGYTIFCSSVIVSVSLLFYGINETILYVNEIVNPRVLLRKRNTEYIYINQVNLKNELSETWDHQYDSESDEWMPSLQHWWERRKTLFLWRLVEISNSDPNDRRRAVETLASYKNLQGYEYQQLAQVCNAETAVTLARVKNIDKRFFLKPYNSNRFLSNEELVNGMRDVLHRLCKSSRHPCLNYFLSKAFPGYKAWNFFSDLESYGFVGTPPTTISDDTVLPLCIEALVHHCTVSRNLKAIIEAGTLQILSECYKKMYLDQDRDSCFHISKVLMELSTHPEFLQDLFQTGWVSILAEWINMEDQRLSIAAASSLANLDSSITSKKKYDREVLLLHPSLRSKEQVTTDVVLIHGLLGGVHYTWRQRGSRKEDMSLFGFADPEEPLHGCVRTTSLAIDEAPQDLKINPKNTDSELGSDYLYVMTDIPVSESVNCNTSCAFDGHDKEQLQCCENAEYTSCWPKDWLPKDCKNLRVIGVNYETRISDWRHWCPLRDRGSKRILSERCKTLLKKLIDCGIGERPVVWIAHSMGGLMLKHMLTQAWRSNETDQEKVCNNTKGIVFLSTPHIGSPWASLHDAWRIFFLPSTEVDELRYKSPVLQSLHDEFLKLVKEHPIEIVSFIETKSMKISTFEWEFLCVPPDTGDTGTGALYKIPLGHLDICKPDGKFSFIYQRILSLVQSVAHSAKNKIK